MGHKSRSEVLQAEEINSNSKFPWNLSAQNICFPSYRRQLYFIADRSFSAVEVDVVSMVVSIVIIALRLQYLVFFLVLHHL